MLQIKTELNDNEAAVLRKLLQDALSALRCKEVNATRLRRDQIITNERFNELCANYATERGVLLDCANKLGMFGV